MKFAMVFPGQGSQSVGMLQAYGDLPEIRDTLREASDVLAQDIAALIAAGPAEELNRTVNTQPVMVTAAIAVYRAWRAMGGAEPAAVAGHSLGEYSALVAAGSLSFADCLPLVRLRAQAMQEAVPEGTGAMAAVLGLDDEGVIAACAEAAGAEIVEAVNFNSPGQVVIAGHAGAVRRAADAAKSRGAKRAVMLPVSAPFHSSLLAPAAQRLREALGRIDVRPPRIPVVHNLDGKTRDTAQGVRDALVGQADHPVRWSQCIGAMADMGIELFLECGPGKVLAPLAGRIRSGAKGVALADRAAMDQALATVSA